MSMIIFLILILKSIIIRLKDIYFKFVKYIVKISF